MKKRTIYISLFLIFIIGLVSLIGTLATDTTITEGNSSKADYLFNITLGDRTNREIVIPSYDSKIVDIKISNPNEFNMSYLLYLEGINSNISIINISDTEASGVLNSKNTNLIKVFIQNNSSTDITVSIKDLVGFEKEILELPSNSTGINKGAYYKAIVKSNNNTYGKVKPNIKLSTKNGTVKYNIVPNDGYQYKSTTCEGTVVDNILTVSNITSNISCEVVFEPKNITISLDLAGGKAETTYTEAKEHTYSVLYNGTYQLEVWGAQGGTTTDGTPGGYGGYSQGTVTLNANSNLYINIGGQGSRTEESVAQEIAGGYNGGGLTGGQSCCGRSFGSGGGATHIAIKSGLLSSLENYKDTILIVAGGGGGSYYGGYGLQGGSGGGYLGADGKEAEAEDSQYCAGLGGSQTIGGSVSTDCYHKNDIVGGITGLFGQGGGSTGATTGGGGGFYGGSRSGHVAPGGGGSGYIGNSSLTDKYMYCYNCATSDGESTKTYSTTNVSEIAISNYAKSGDGAAKITLISNANYNVTYKDKYGTLPTPTRTGYTFEGWYTGENGTGTKITSDTVLTNENNHTLYAKWTKKNIIVSYNLSYDVSNVQNWLYANGFESRFTNSYDSSTGTSTISCAGSGGWEIIYFEMDTIANTEYEVTFEYEIPSSYKTLSGYSGIGYQALTAIGDSDNSSNSLAVKYLPTSATTSAQKTTLSFKATTTKTYFALNFGMAADGVTTTIKIKNVNVKYKNTITTSYGDKYGTMPTPTRVGYTFEGWYTGENGTGTKVDENTTLTNENNHTLYAKWTPNTYYLDLNGFLDGAGSGVIAGYGTADVYIDGVLVCDDCTDYYVEHPYGTHYSISDIKNSAGHTYNGVYSGSVNGTIKGPTSLLLSFSTNTYTITTNYYRYQDSSWIHFDSRTDTALYGSSFSPYNIAAPAGYYASNSFSYFDSASNPLGTGTVGVDSIAVIGNMTVNVHYYSSDTTKPTCTLSANASTITATASDDKGIAYQGWSSSYSGSNSASKSISAGTHTYYVKDTSGNTNTCSLSIASTINESYTYSDTCTKNVKLKSCSTKCTCSSGWYTSSGWAGPGCYETQYYTCTKEGTRIACSSGYTKINDNWCYK